MAFDVGELFAGISLDDAKYKAGLRKARDDGEEFERKGIKPKVDIDTTAAQSKLGRLGALIDQNSTKLKSVGRDMTMYVTAPIVAAGTASVVLAGQLEQSRIAFETLLGSRSEADAFLETLEQFAKATPFQFTDLVEQSKRLMAYGFEAKQIIPVLTSVGDATAALGSGAEGIERITRAIGQIQAKGRVQAEEMRQLAEAGVPAWQMLAESMHMSVQQLMKEVEQGRVAADDAITILLEGMDERYGGLMEKQSKSILGQFSNLMDELKMTAAEFGLAMKPFLEPVLDIFRGMLSVLGSLPGPLKTVIGVLGGIAAVIGPSLWAIGRMSEGVRALKDLWGFFRPAQVAADTAAVSANTAAVEANSAARMRNAKTPPVGSSGVLPGPIGTGAGGLGGSAAAGGGSVIGGLAAGSAGSAAAVALPVLITGASVVLLTRDLNNEPGMLRRGVDPETGEPVNVGTRRRGRGGTNDPGVEADRQEERRESLELRAALRDQIASSHTATDAEEAATGATDLNTTAVGGLTGAVADAAASVESLTTASLEQINAMMALPGGIAGALAAASNAEAREQADKMLKKRYKHGIDWSQVADTPGSDLAASVKAPGSGIPDWPRKSAAKGIDFTTNGPELLLVGDNPSGREHVKVTPSEAGGASGRGGLVVNLRVDNLYGTDKAALSRFADQIGTVLARKVRYANA